MTRTICLPILTGALAIAFCVAPLGPPTTKEATAQGIWVPSNTQPYYNTPQPYFSNPQPYYRSPQAYQSAYYYNSYGLGYSNVYQSGYRGYGASNYGTTVYSNGPYANGSPRMFTGAAPNISYGTSYGPATRVFRYGGPSYSPIYAPASARYYSPYGYRRY